jgi:hypothetical protein
MLQQKLETSAREKKDAINTSSTIQEMQSRIEDLQTARSGLEKKASSDEH